MTCHYSAADHRPTGGRAADPRSGGIMQRIAVARLALSASAVLILGCESHRPFEPSSEPALARGRTASTEFATLSTLPALSRSVHGEAYAVQRSGGIIAGYSYDRDDRMIPVTWTLQNGTWTIAALPYPTTAVGGRAKGVNDQGDVAGNDWPGTAPHAVLWPSTGGFEVLGCNELGEVYGMSAAGRVLVGVVQTSQARASVWQPGQCRVDLPPLVVGGAARADAVNGDGSVVGGSASGLPVRWTRVNGSWQIEQLDARQGAVRGANSG